jgi:tetratricopeptide (TPR) repeat protein
MTVRPAALFLLALSAFPLSAQVRAWEEQTVIPTYQAGPPDANPFFFTGRAYQGAKGVVYPYPMYDNLTDEKVDRTYTLACLENEYLKVCVLPEIGGRIFEAVDKTNGYNFFYKQNVIKPALIGMLGAWISGGVEWNVPHHHRASSFLPVRHKMQDNPDGSKTVWVGEMELHHRMRWAIGLTLRPGTSLLEAQVTALNTTPLAHSLLYFANVAVHTNENYQVLFPPRTQFATQHAKREFARWPIADSIYGGIDFTRGVDVSLWKNHPSAISMFAWNEEDDFLAGYDHGRQAGTMHVADRHQVPGKKFFAWGTGPSGRLWDKILSDADGPYLELMVGAWSDNQPDYSWLQPYEAKSVRQYWYPFRGIGGAKEATRDAAVNLEVKNGKVKAGFHVTSRRAGAVASVTAGGQVLWTETAALDPGTPLVREFDLPAGVREGDLEASLRAGDRVLVSYRPPVRDNKPMPPPVVPPGPPEKFKTNEELYLAGLRLEQFHNPSLAPDPYYEEALRRDPGDSRANTALALLHLKRGRYADAVTLLRRAADRVQHNYTRAKDGEPLYYLGLALKLQNRLEEADDMLQRAAWCHGWQSAALMQSAEIRSRQGRFNDALELLDRSLVTNAWNTRALSLKSLILTRLGDESQAGPLREQIARLDPLDPRGVRRLGELATIAKTHPEEGLELAVSCINAGLWFEAGYLLDRMPTPSPPIDYWLGWLALRGGQKDTAKARFAKAAAMPLDRVFPFQLEMIEPLRAAMELNPQDARAPYYLGLLLFDHQPEEAMKLWRTAVANEPSLAIAHRNLAVGYSLQDDGVPHAVQALEKAVELNPNDALYLFELDRLYEFQQAPLEKRLALFDAHADTARNRDDTMSRDVTVRVLAGQLDRAIETMEKRRFNLWEGGARFNVQDAWTDAHLLRGHRQLKAAGAKGALADYLKAIEYPENLEVTRAYRGSRAPEVFYWAGVAYEALGRKDEAKKAWRESVAELLGTEENPHPGVDSGAALLYYRALSLAKLGDAARARALFQSLLDTASEALKRAEGTQFFAKFGERQSPRARAAMAHYLAGLGWLGLENKAKAQAEFRAAVKLNPYHLGALTMLE